MANRMRQEKWQEPCTPTYKYDPVKKDFWTEESNLGDETEPLRQQEKAQAEQGKALQEEQEPEAEQQDQEVQQDDDTVSLPPLSDEEERLQVHKVGRGKRRT